MRVAALLLALAVPAAAGHPASISLKVCLVYEYTVVGNPVSATATSCFDVMASGPVPAQAVQNAWKALSSADERAAQLWDDMRRNARERSWLTLALRRVTATDGVSGAVNSADFPPSGPGSVAYRRVRVWLPGGAYEFDYVHEEGLGPPRLLDIGKTIGESP